MLASMLLFVAAALLPSALATAAPKPHILMCLIDDFGWANVGFHRPEGFNETRTPNMDGLAKSGVELDRHYVFKYCSPSRSALQSGRNPIHVNVLNIDMNTYNKHDPVGGFAGVPRNMTGLATIMKRAGYKTHMAGKWDAGMATHDATPLGRGYDTALFYFKHCNDYWTDMSFPNCKGIFTLDLWKDNEPAWGLNNPSTCSQGNQKGCTYEDELFENELLQRIGEHDPSEPMFMFWAPHAIHTADSIKDPIQLEVPDSYLANFTGMDNEFRRDYAAMVKYVDDVLGRLVGKLKEKGMWNNTLLVLSSDNGGPVYGSGVAGANNYPLRGGKLSNWEGGIRANAFVAGGFLPDKVRGTKQEGLITVWDWYATFAHLAGEDPTDKRAELAKLPPIDSLNMWPLVSGQVNESPRTEVPIGSGTTQTHNTKVEGLIQGRYKLLTGIQSSDFWQGPYFPNATLPPPTASTNCLDPDVVPGAGCLFDIIADPTEQNNLAKTHKDVVKKLRDRMKELQAGVYDPNRGHDDGTACEVAYTKYRRNGSLPHWGPFLP